MTRRKPPEKTPAAAQSRKDGRSRDPHVLPTQPDEGGKDVILEAFEASRRDGAPPESLLHWARSWARTVSRSAPTFSSRILGLLSHQSFAAPALRSAAPASEARLYGDDEYQLDLRVEEKNNGMWRLRGQVVSLVSSEENWKVLLCCADADIREEKCNEFGEFVFDETPPGPWMSVIAESASVRLHLPRIKGPDRNEE